MMRYILLLWLGLWANLSLFGQSPSLLVVKNGADLSQAVPVGNRYAYPDFRSGSITYRNGRQATARLNYQLLLGEVQFLNAQGDTLSLADELTLQEILIEEDVYWYDSQYGYLKRMADYGSIQLAVKEILQPGGVKKQTAYGQTSATSASTNYQVYRDQNGSLKPLTPQSEVVLSREVTYYFRDRNLRLHRANKANTLKVYAKQKARIKLYLKANPVDFHQKEDLDRLYQFCSQ